MKVRTILLCSLLLWAVGAQAAVLFVSPSGDDEADGGEHSPLKSLVEARDRVRELSRGQGDHFVILRNGRHELSKPLNLDERDGGMNGTRVVWKAFPGEVARISGGRVIEGWSQAANGIWTAHVPKIWNFRELFVNGKRRVRARFPDQGYLRIAKAGDDRRTWFLFNEGDLPEIKGVSSLELVFLHDWSISRVGIKSINHGTKRVDLTDGVGCSADHYAMDHFEKQPRYFLENSKQFLNQPGEWYLDPEAELLFYKPMPGEDVSKAEVIAPWSSGIIQAAGKGAPIRNLEFEGLVFEHSHFEIPETGYVEGQASYYEIRGSNQNSGMKRVFTPAAIHLTHAEDCRFSNCEIRHTGGGGIWIGERTRFCSVERSRIHDTSGNGVMLGEDRTRRIGNQIWHDAAPEQISTGNWLIDSEVHHVGQQFYGSVGVWVGITRETLVDRNHIHDLPYTGVSIGWRWDARPTGAADNSVSWNHIHDIMLKLSDGGGIYSLGHQPGSRMLGNRIHGVRVNAGRAESNGMFLDQGTSELLIAGNTIHDIARSPLRFHQASTNYVERNTLVTKKGVPHIRFNNTRPERILEADNVVLEEKE